MKKIFLLTTFASACVLSTQTPSCSIDAALGLDQQKQKFHSGDTMTFSINLNEPLPKDEYLQVRISPAATGPLVMFNSGESVDTTRTKFRITGKLPEQTIPGKWHVDSVLMMGPANLSNNGLKSNDTSFEVEGKPLVLPTSAEIKIDK